MRALLSSISAFGLTVLVSHPVLAEKRVALVMGNSAYQNVPNLTNPKNDAAAVATMLKSAGFDSIESRSNMSVAEMRKALREFGSKSRGADVAVVYYAGHGIELDGTNYLIPVDATLETDADVLDEAVSLDRVLFAVEPAKQLRLVILDACRDNPFAATMKRTIASRAVGRGLAKVEPNSPNTMIAFAAKAGSTASDGDNKNGPFAAALVEHLPKPGLDLRRAFGFVRDDVLKTTSNKQEPYVYGSLGGNDVPLVAAKSAASAPSLPQADPQAAVRRDYELSLQLDSREGWDAFLRTYPEGFYADLAKGQLKKIAAEEARAVAAEKAKQAEQEKARLIAEGAKQVELAKAAAAAKAAEYGRIAAEEVKAAEQEKAAAAEKSRLAEQEKAATAEQARVVADKAAAENGQQVAALAPSDIQEKTSSADVARSLQTELRRVGCSTGAVDGNWNTASQRSIDMFNKHAGLKLEAKVASVDALEAVRSKTARVCPLTCERGFRADGDHCVKVTCEAGFRVNEDYECEKAPERPVAKREDALPKRDAERRQNETAPEKPQASGQIICSMQGCRPVQKGCRIEQYKPGISGHGSNGGAGQVEICN